MTDAQGNILGEAAFTAWGSALFSTLPNTPFRWEGRVGEYEDSETGLVLCGARYYSPLIGLFITRDPIGFKGGVNVYSYCAGNPVMLADPSGTKGASWWMPDVPTPHWHGWNSHWFVKLGGSWTVAGPASYADQDLNVILQFNPPSLAFQESNGESPFGGPAIRNVGVILGFGCSNAPLNSGSSEENNIGGQFAIPDGPGGGINYSYSPDGQSGGFSGKLGVGAGAEFHLCKMHNETITVGDLWDYYLSILKSIPGDIGNIFALRTSDPYDMDDEIGFGSPGGPGY